MRGWIVALLLSLSACSGSEALIRPAVPAQAPWQITDPRAFDLKMPDDLFRGRLAAYPDIDRCHTQGLEIIDDQIVISCTLFNQRFKTRQSFVAESLILKAPLRMIEKPDLTATPTWQMTSLTETVPADESPRIARSLLATLPEPIAWLIKRLYAPETIEYTMGHPSGLHYDPQLDRLWVSNAVYGPKSYSHLRQLDPQTLRPKASQPTVAIRDHLGTVLGLSKHLVLSTAWGSPHTFRLIDTKNKRSRILQLATDDEVHYQDCDLWDAKTFFCVGNRVRERGFLHEARGRLHVIHINGQGYEDLELNHGGGVVWRRTDRLDSLDLGERLFYYIEGIGDVEQGPLNKYGEFRTPLPLSQEGFAVSPDQHYVYFLPADLPRGKLIRMTLQRPSP